MATLSTLLGSNFQGNSGFSGFSGYSGLGLSGFSGATGSTGTSGFSGYSGIQSPLTTDVGDIVVLTQAEYDLLLPAIDTLYIITA